MAADDGSFVENLKSDDVFATCSSSCKQAYDAKDVCKLTVHRKLRPRKFSDVVLQNDITRKIRSVIRQVNRSADDEIFLEQHQSLVKLVETRRLAYTKSKERTKEIEDDPEVVCEKVKQLAVILQSSKHAIVYTGAGISTSANIPDYRGARGVWHQLSVGQSIKMDQNLASVIPSFTHCAICRLVQSQLVKYVVSQNCDGLHLRSGLSPKYLAEIHGNMYAEICNACSKPYYRVFDVTECTGLRQHYTNRICDTCHGKLKDTIVHFGERSDAKWPHNWNEAEQNAEDCDLILCLGSSLKVLRSYKKLWLTDRKKEQRPTLCIVNMQWTPKDSQAQLKIHGKTDQVMAALMKHLNIDVPLYAREKDPLFEIAVPLNPSQYESFHSQCVSVPEEYKSKFPETICRQTFQALKTSCLSSTSSHVRQSKAESSSLINATKLEIKDGCHATGTASENYDTKNLTESFLLQNICTSIKDDVVNPSALEISSLPTTISSAPAWFGKGRKVVKKRATTKRRRKTT